MTIAFGEQPIDEEPNQRVGIDVKGVRKRFAAGGPSDAGVLDGVSFRVQSGECVAILGPNGAGKTTLLRIIGGLTEADQGEVRISQGGDRTRVPRVGMVFQDYAESLLPWRTNLDNVALALEVAGISRKARLQLVRRRLSAWARRGETLDRTGDNLFAQMGIPEDGYPYELSGGQKQWLAVVRAFMDEPELALLDEPFGAFDQDRRLAAQERLARLHERLGLPMIVVSHEIDEAIYLADRVLMMRKRPSAVVETFEVDLPRPRPPIETLIAMPRFQSLRAHLESQFLRVLRG